jgi:hypothetical protein
MIMSTLLAASQGHDWTSVAILAIFCLFAFGMAVISRNRR